MKTARSSETTSDSLTSSKQLLIDYYEEIQQEIKGLPSKTNDLDQLALSDIINGIRESVNILIQIKIEEELTKQSKNEYESILQKLEADIRNHFKIESQLRLQIQSLEDKLKMILDTPKDKNRVMQINDNKFNNNDYYYDEDDYDSIIPLRINNNKKEQELLLLQAENSNLKATIEKYETIIQHFDQKEKEMNEEFKKEKQQLLNDIDALNKKISITKNRRNSIHSNSNINFNINDLRDSNNFLKSKGEKHRQDTKNKKVEVILSSRTPNQPKKRKGRLQSFRGKSTIQSKENSTDMDDEFGSPRVQNCNSKTKYISKLNESNSNKNYFLTTYKKMMSMNSPIRTLTTHNSTYQSLQNTSRKERKDNAHNTCSSKSVKPDSNQTNKHVQNPTLSLFSDKKYTITNFNTYKSQKPKDDKIYRPSTSRDQKKKRNIVFKK